MTAVFDMKFWNQYWYAPHPLLDLAVVRVICCLVTIPFIIVFHDAFGKLAEVAALPDTSFRPIFLLKLLHAPLGWGFSGEGGADGLGVWGYRPPEFVVEIFLYLFVIFGVLSLIGFLTNLSLIIFSFSFFYSWGYLISFGDFHHSQAVMCIVLFALALSPSGRVLSIDQFLRARRGVADYGGLSAESTFAGWPIKLTHWLFVFMYLSAAYAKISVGGFDWMNGYTLQFNLIRDGLRWSSDLAVWLSHFHYISLVVSIGVMVFQLTFFLEVLYPKLRWLYIPIGLSLHISIYILLKAPFFTWIALYSVFIPWRDFFTMLAAQNFGSRRNV